jgi:hypothetical protein
MKGQITIDASLLTMTVVIAAVILISYLLFIYNSTSSDIKNSYVFSIQSISFSPRLPLSPYNDVSYPGSYTLSIYSSSTPSFDNIILIQPSSNTLVSSKSTCSGYMFNGFSQNGMICDPLAGQFQILPEGNDQYLIIASNSFYNITEYEASNSSSSVGGYVKYIEVVINGKISYQELNPEIPVEIST